MMLKISFAVLALFAFTAQAAIFTPCKWDDVDNGIFEVNATDVRMEGCLSQPCIVERGKDYLVEIDFTSIKAQGRFSHDVTMDISGVEIPWPGDFPNGCDSLIKGDCPLVTNEAATASALLEIRNSIPAFTTTAIWKLVNDDTDEVIVCFTVRIRIL